jgi:cellulose synthase/poly-beta-1,6-N-acetylglucosamine synthase-like glycosyltransferase
VLTPLESLLRLWAPPAAEGAFGPPLVTHGILFVVLLCVLVDLVKHLIELLGRSGGRAFHTDPSLVTAVIPSRNGAQVLPHTIEDLRRSLPAGRILVIDDGSTDGTSAVAAAQGCVVHRFERSKGKAGAINFAVHRVTTPYTLLLDDDTRLGGARLPTSLLSDAGVDAVAFHVLPDRRNRDGARGNTFLGALQRYEYGKSMEIGKRFHDVTQSVSCISGAAGLFRTADLQALHHRHTGVFQGEDLQRTIIHLLAGRRIAFANEPVWTVAPERWGAWFRQRVLGWYPGLYHQVANFFRLFAAPRVAWRLRYEMAYNLYTTFSDPLKVWSMIVILFTPGMRWWALGIYLIYLLSEIYPWSVIRTPGTGKRAPLAVLLAYPVYGAVNTILRTLAVVTWFWYRYVTRTMRPRRGPKDRIP